MDFAAECLMMKYRYKMTEKDMNYKNTPQKVKIFKMPMPKGNWES